jgi:predicted NBD/HSP70 family sugar kinase
VAVVYAGCLETLAAGQRIMATIEEPLKSFPENRVLSLAGGHQQVLTPQGTYDAARVGDPAARAMFQHAGHVLRVSLANLVNTVAPSGWL